MAAVNDSFLQHTARQSSALYYSFDLPFLARTFHLSRYMISTRLYLNWPLYTCPFFTWRPTVSARIVCVTGVISCLRTEGGSCNHDGVPIITTGSLKSRKNWSPGMPIFTGVYIFHDTVTHGLLQLAHFILGGCPRKASTHTACALGGDIMDMLKLASKMAANSAKESLPPNMQLSRLPSEW